MAGSEDFEKGTGSFVSQKLLLTRADGIVEKLKARTANSLVRAVFRFDEVSLLQFLRKWEAEILFQTPRKVQRSLPAQNEGFLLSQY